MIINATKKEQMTSSHKEIRSLFAQAFGLMFRKPLQDEGWVFCFSRSSKWHITNFCVFQDIAVFWLDNNKKVLQKSLVPAGKMHVSGILGTKYVLELPPEQIHNANVGDMIVWK